MKQFRYNLDKSSKKFVCPSCNKRTFVKYIDIKTNSYLGDAFGRCDRESNCNYHSTPKGEASNSFEIVNSPKPLPSYHSPELIEKSFLSERPNYFIDFLHTMFTAVEVKTAVYDYLISTSIHWEGATVFWQIDQQERLHAGKVMLFNKATGKRAKDSNGKSIISWVHSILKYKKQLNDFNLEQCLFGLHLITPDNSKPMAIVEGEKTAVLCSVFKPQYTWLATGSKSGLKCEMLLPIKKYKIVAFPDKNEFSDWNKKATELNKVGFQIVVSNYLETIDCDVGTDFADILIQNSIVNNNQIQ